jgi:CelD/BcsL family acetyltransferase involved in cellulose biosynthesis
LFTPVTGKKLLSERKDIYIIEMTQEVKVFKGLKIRFEPISDIKEIWDNLFKKTEKSSPFLTYGWFFALSKYLLKKDMEVMVFSKKDEVVGIIPAWIKNNKLMLIGDKRVTDCSGIISNPNYTKKVIESLTSFIVEENLSFELYPIAKDNEILQFPLEALKEKTMERIEPLAVLKLYSSWEQYLRGLSSKNRHEVKRKLNKVKGIEVKDLKATEIDRLFELMEYSKSKKEFLTDEMKNFFKALASYLEGIGALRLRATYFKKDIFGVIFAFEMADTVYAFNTGYNAKFYKLSPGFVSFAVDIKLAIAEGFSYYNFLRGEERFKFDLGAKRTYIWKIRG